VIRAGYSIPITDGSVEITHKGLSTVLSQSFFDMLVSLPKLPGVADVIGAFIMVYGPAQGIDAMAREKPLMGAHSPECWFEELAGYLGTRKGHTRDVAA
jgi:hypothetical protein